MKHCESELHHFLIAKLRTIASMFPSMAGALFVSLEQTWREFAESTNPRLEEKNYSWHFQADLLSGI